MDNPRTIPVRCEYSHLLSLGDLKDFQAGAKTRTRVMRDRLRASILRLGFAFPIFFWRSRAGVCWTLDGHGRLQVLADLFAEGYQLQLPDRTYTQHLPAIEVSAATRGEAYQMLLALNSRYGVFTEEGLFALAEADKEFAQQLEHAQQSFALLPDVDAEVILQVLREGEQTVADVFRRELLRNAGVQRTDEEQAESAGAHSETNALSPGLPVQSRGKSKPSYTGCPVCGADLLVVFEGNRWVLYPAADHSSADEEKQHDANGNEAV